MLGKEDCSRKTIPIFALIVYLVVLIIVFYFVKNGKAQIVISLAAVFISFVVWAENFFELVRDLKGYFIGDNPSLREERSNLPTTANTGVLEAQAEILLYNPSSKPNIINSQSYFLRIDNTVDYRLVSIRNHKISVPLVIEGYKAFKYNIDLMGEKDVPKSFAQAESKCILVCVFKTIFGKDLIIESPIFIAGK